MRLGALIPGLAGEQVARADAREGPRRRLHEAGRRGDRISVLKDLGETNIEIDDGKSQVRITCE